MNIIEIATALIITLTGLALIVFFGLTLVAKDKAISFMQGFASSPLTHFFEQILRIIVGAALVAHSPKVAFELFFNVLGWLMILSSVGLILIPWRWHKKFADLVIPTVIQYIYVYATCCLLLGLFFLFVLIAP